MDIKLTINGEEKYFRINPGDILLDVLRDNGYKSVKKGCGSADCGTCTVLINGRAMLSCSILAASVDGKTVETLEGLGSDNELHPIQKAFLDTSAFQCGFCAPGLILSTKELLENHVSLSEEQIKHELAGNLCRCTGYENQIRAVKNLFKEKNGEV
jgi:carbon-monoxide dehydrogenase small subunit